MTFGKIRFYFFLTTVVLVFSVAGLGTGSVAKGQANSDASATTNSSTNDTTKKVDSKAGAKADSKGKRTTIDFEDELIEGQTQKPDLSYLLQKRDFNYKRMIKLRENFLPEMRKTSEDMRRKGSGD